MFLIQLPFELQLLILCHIKKDNHLDLAPLSQTCTHYSSLVADRFNWGDTVTILQPSAIHSSSLKFLMNATVANHKKRNSFVTKKLQVMNNDPKTMSLITNILGKQQFENNIQHIELLIPANSHHQVYQTLIDHPQAELTQLTIRDPTDDGYIMNSNAHHMLLQFLSKTLSKSQLTLNQLDLLSFPSNIIVAQLTNYQFPHVKCLKIALVGCQDENQYPQYWKQFKAIFPNVHELTLTLSKQHVSLFKFLLQDVTLFPWIKRLSIKSGESPKNYLTQEELRTSLLQLNGLNRITAGWDMIALI